MESSGSSLMIELMMTFVVFTPSILLFTRDVIKFSGLGSDLSVNSTQYTHQ
jgi:hypothetical protein